MIKADKVIGLDNTCRLCLPMNDNYPDCQDISHYGNHGAVTGAVKAKGLNSECYGFNGTSDFINCGANSSLNIIDEITVSGWLKTSNVAQSNYIVSKDDGGGGRAYSLKVESSKIRFLLWNSGGALVSIYSNACSLTDNEWTHFAVIRESNNTMRTYINGVVQTSTGNISDIKSVAQALYIGRMNISYFAGSLSNVMILSRALSPTEIHNLYSSQKPF